MDIIFSGLKKVSDDMKTHKNPALRQGPAPFKPPISAKPTKTVSAPQPTKKVETEKPPVCELQNKKWIIVSEDKNHFMHFFRSIG